MKKSITKSLLISASVLTAIATSLPVVADTTSTPVADSSTGLISSVDNGSTATEPTKPVDMTELPHTNDNNSVGLQAVGFLLTLFGLGGLVSLKKQKQ